MAETAFDALVLVEGSGRPELKAALGEIERTVTASSCGLAAPVSQVYDPAYQLSATELS